MKILRPPFRLVYGIALSLLMVPLRFQEIAMNTLYNYCQISPGFTCDNVNAANLSSPEQRLIYPTANHAFKSFFFSLIMSVENGG